jgi:hypothetical protein
MEQVKEMVNVTKTTLDHLIPKSDEIFNQVKILSHLPVAFWYGLVGLPTTVLVCIEKGQEAKKLSSDDTKIFIVILIQYDTELIT